MQSSCSSWGGNRNTRQCVYACAWRVCMYTCHTCTHTHAYTDTSHTNCCKHIHMPTGVCMCMWVCVCACTRVTCIHTCTSHTLHLHKCTCPHRVCMYMCMYVCMWVHVCVHTHLHRTLMYTCTHTTHATCNTHDVLPCICVCVLFSQAGFLHVEPQLSLHEAVCSSILFLVSKYG